MNETLLALGSIALCLALAAGGISMLFLIEWLEREDRDNKHD
jgi:hypothetical protein